MHEPASPTSVRERRDRGASRSIDRAQRGSVMLVAMVAMAGMLALAGLTVLSTKSRLSVSASHRFNAVALYAAESGVVAGVDFLRTSIDADDNWTTLVSASNASPMSPLGIVGNGVEPGATGYPFAADSQAWYEVTVLNNILDPGYAAGQDLDGRVVLRVVGHGPNNASAILEVELSADGVQRGSQHCPGYAQRGIAADGAGRNDCLDQIEGTATSTYRPGG